MGEDDRDGPDAHHRYEDQDRDQSGTDDDRCPALVATAPCDHDAGSCAATALALTW
jgi:hypothetical protein